MIFDPKVYEYSTPLRGDAAAAFDVARTALLAQGFEILTDEDAELSAEGPGMRGTQQSPLAGVSKLQLHVASSTLSATATLGGAARMKMFLYLFPPALALFLMISFALAGMGVVWISAVAVAPWVVISPLMASAIERRTTKAVDGLVRSMARVADRK